MKTSPLAAAHSLAQLQNRLRLILPYLHCPTLGVTSRYDPCQPAFEALLEEPYLSRCLVLTSVVSHVPYFHCPVQHQVTLALCRYWALLQLYMLLPHNKYAFSGSCTAPPGRISARWAEWLDEDWKDAILQELPVLTCQGHLLVTDPTAAPLCRLRLWRALGSVQNGTEGSQREAMSSTAIEDHHDTTHAGVRLKVLSVMPRNGIWLLHDRDFQSANPWRQPPLGGTSAVWTQDTCCLWTQGVGVVWDPSALIEEMPPSISL